MEQKPRRIKHRHKPPDVMRKGGPMRVRSKYTRKGKSEKFADWFREPPE